MWSDTWSNSLRLRQGCAELRSTRALDPRRLAVRANSVHLQQVVLNLALNGIDAMRDCAPGNRRLMIQTGLLKDATVEVVVSDTGSGIPADMLNRVFEPFFTTKQDGIGLGLSIAHTIIERMGGTISAQNRPAGGATFRFTLPAAATFSGKHAATEARRGQIAVA